MGTPTSRCCLAHWAMETLNGQRPAELVEPGTSRTVVYVADHAEHLWVRTLYDQDGQWESAIELYTLLQLFGALHHDAQRGCLPLENGVTVAL